MFLPFHRHSIQTLLIPKRLKIYCCLSNTKVGGDENSAESLKIFAESVSNGFPGENEQRILNSLTVGKILFIKIVFIRLSVGKNAE
jgi:hypothetical protein